MQYQIESGHESDIPALEQLYNDINDYLAATVNYSGWKRGVYPTVEDAISGVKDGCLYTAKHNGEIVGTLILRDTQEPQYVYGTWQKPLRDEEVYVIHPFVVSPKYLQRGVGTELLGFCDDCAAKHKKKALRLDVYEKNIPAIKLYEKCGYTYAGTVSLGLEKYGLDRFRLYEKEVN